LSYNDANKAAKIALIMSNVQKKVNQNEKHLKHVNTSTINEGSFWIMCWSGVK